MRGASSRPFSLNVATGLLQRGFSLGTAVNSVSSRRRGDRYKSFTVPEALIGPGAYHLYDLKHIMSRPFGGISTSQSGFLPRGLPMKEQ